MRTGIAVGIASGLFLMAGFEFSAGLLAGHGHRAASPAPISGTAAQDRALIQGSSQVGFSSVTTGAGSRGYRWGAARGQRYGQNAYRAPVSPEASEDQVNYEQKVKDDPFFEQPHVPAATKATIDNLIEKMAGVHSEDRRRKAEDAVNKLADLGEQASVKLAEYTEGEDTGLSLYCLKVMDKASFVRYEPILLNMLENRADLPKDLGDAAVGVFAKHADASTLSGLLRLIINEKNPSYLKDVCPIVWKLQTPALWKRVLKYADVTARSDSDFLALMELQDADVQRRIAKVFNADPNAAAGAANDEDISIGLAKNGASDDSLARTIAAMVVAWSARPEFAKPIDAMAHDSDDTVMFYGLVGQAHLRNEAALVPLIDFLGSERWDVRRDAQTALSDLTGTTLDYDFASVHADRVKGFARWVSFAKLKNASKNAEYPASDGWKELSTKFVTEPRSVLFDTDTAFKSLGEAGTEFLTPVVVEGRWESIPVSNTLGKLPLHLDQQSSMLFRVDLSRHIVSTALVKDGAGSDKVNFQRIATATLPTPTTPVGLGNKQPCSMLKLDYNPLPAAARAYSFASYDSSTRTIPYMRAGYVEGIFDDVAIRVYDDDNNGDFNDYGSDAVQIAGQRYASLLSSTLCFGKTFYEFRISRSGDKMWIKPYEGALGSIHIKPPELNGFRVLDLQVQSGARVFDITGAVNAPMPLPVGKYQIVHAAVAVASSRALVTEGANGFFEVEADKVTEKAFANKLTVHVQPEIIDECDICSLKSKYPVPKGGQVLKIHVPYIEDGGDQTYGRFDSKLARINVECSAPSGRRLFSSAWNAAEDGFLPFYFVLQPRSMENGSYKISVKLDLAPFGQIKGQGIFSPSDSLIQVRP